MDNNNEILKNNRKNMNEKYNIKKKINEIPKKYYKDIIVVPLNDLQVSFQGCKREICTDKRCMKETQKRIKDFIQSHRFTDKRDHIEYYEDINRNIISVWSKWSNQEQIEYAEKCGYVNIEPIYALDQKTFIKVILKI